MIRAVRITNILREIIHQTADYSLLSRNESNAIKGLLMLLIIIGHNKYLMTDSYIFRFLYSFHIYAFYFLPFLYNYKDEEIKIVCKRNLKRLFVPYTFIFLLLIVVGLIWHHPIKIEEYCWAFITGSQYNLRNALSFGGFLWFIPTMFSVLMFRQLYYRYPKVRIYILLLSIIALICYAFRIFVNIQQNAPCSIFIALAMIFPGLLVRYIFNHCSLPKIGLAFFCLLIGIFIIYPSENLNFEYLVCNRLLCPLIIFSFLLFIKEAYTKYNWLVKLGQNSFSIYIIHIFLYNITYLLIDKIINVNFYFSIILLLIIILLSYTISLLHINKIIFPH